MKNPFRVKNPKGLHEGIFIKNLQVFTENPHGDLSGVRVRVRVVVAMRLSAVRSGAPP